MKLPWAEPLAAARARIATEDALHRRVRLAVRELWDAGEQLEASPSPPSKPAPLAALRREAVRLAAQALPFPALADSADARLSLSRLMEQGLDEVPSGEVERLLAVAREAHARALSTLEESYAEEHAIVRRRQLTLGALAVVVCMGASVVGQWMIHEAQPVDLAAGKHFTQSSMLDECHPEQNLCGRYPTRIAFHTRAEESPWYQVDLGAPVTISGATIVNRQDMALFRAVPLVLEVSDDGKTFREVARQVEVFDWWAPHFPPQTARYFRARVDRYSMLHLEAMRVHP